MTGKKAFGVVGAGGTETFILEPAGWKKKRSHKHEPIKKTRKPNGLANTSPTLRRNGEALWVPPPRPGGGNGVFKQGGPQNLSTKLQTNL